MRMNAIDSAGASAVATIDPVEPDGRWQAVVARDPNYDGVFVYAVRSTGIYCRPWCPSRRPRREQVLFQLVDRLR